MPCSVTQGERETKTVFHRKQVPGVPHSGENCKKSKKSALRQASYPFFCRACPPAGGSAGTHGGRLRRCCDRAAGGCGREGNGRAERAPKGAPAFTRFPQRCGQNRSAPRKARRRRKESCGKNRPLLPQKEDGRQRGAYQCPLCSPFLASLMARAKASVMPMARMRITE